ncbi:MAG: SUMF1/EgtB/PvdO family nonheme iron enzyme [Akkermansiaceae bacterium]
MDIGNAGNSNDGVSGSTAYGGVAYNYRMGVHEVSRGMIDAYNADSGGPALTMSDMTSLGGNGANRPATGVSWNEAARFVNWLNNSTGHAAAYQFDTTGGNDNIALWEVGDAGYDASNPFRNSNAHYFLPSEDEWYKAAYYDGTTGTYYDYATGSDTAPTTTSGGTLAGTAVYRDGVNPNPAGPADITNAGGLSPYGTMAQSGNVREWGESGHTAPNDSAAESRLIRGGFWSNGSNLLQSSFRSSNSPPIQGDFLGFRVAAVPEPSGVTLLVVGAMGLLMRRKRG